MNVKAYPLYDHAVAMQPARERARISATVPVFGADGQGWNLLCPAAFEATWHGGSRPEDIEIRLLGAPVVGDQRAPAFVQSQLGDGLLSFYPGYQFKTANDQLLWLRGPLNAPKDGISLLESLVDASLLPATVAVHWQFTRPHQTIRFAAGEPFATLLLYPQSDGETLTVEEAQGNGDEPAYAQAFQQMADNPALRDLFLGLVTSAPTEHAAPHANNGQPTPSTAAAQPTHSAPDDSFDTVDGRLDLTQFDPALFRRERLIGTPEENALRRYGEVRPRIFYVIDPLKLVYLETPKVACTAIRMALAPASGINFDRGEGFEYRLYTHPQWRRVVDRLKQAQSDYYRFSFVRNPFDRLVSCYRSKVIFQPSPAKRSPHFHGYFFAIPPNISFADFVERVSQIPDALADAHFKSQSSMLYCGDELQVDYLGKFERLADDWRPIAERYGLDPLLEAANVSKTKPGCPSDYRLYYSEPLVQMVYNRYRKDIERFGYQAEYEQLLAFVRQHPQQAVAGLDEENSHKASASSRSTEHSNQ